MAPSGYNSAPMSNLLHFPNAGDPAQIGWAELISNCAQDRENPALWTEFLRRYGPKIKYFIIAACRNATASAEPFIEVTSRLGGMQDGDLVQSTIMRLVEHDCAAMKSFSGTSEDQWLVYLAVIARSIVREALRRHRAQKRPELVAAQAPMTRATDPTPGDRERTEHLAMERKILADEVRRLCERTISSMAGESTSRDILIFRLYFEHDLSTRQISRCQGVNLTKAGVENVINRLRNRIRDVLSAGVPEAMSR